MKVRWSRGQHAAFDELILSARAYFEPGSQTGPLRPRFDRLVVGPSGTGKSHLVRAIGEELGVQVLKLSIGEWIVNGSRHPISTMGQVQQCLESNHRLIIHVDEIDKIRSDFRTDWAAYFQSELFNLLDRQPTAATHRGHWTMEQRRRLRENTWIVASGTWQHIWDRMGRSGIGFQPNIAQDFSHEVQRTPIIATELRRRFAANLIVIPPPTATDYREAATAFGLDTLAAMLGESLDFTEAVTSSLGARWLEETYARLLVRAMQLGRTDLFPSPPPEVEEEL